MNKLDQYLNTLGRNNYRNANGNGAPASGNKLSRFNQTFRLTITNASNVASTYVLFGYNENGESASIQGDGVTVTGQPSTLLQMSRATANTPVGIVQMKLKVSDVDEFDNEITYTRKDTLTGAERIYRIFPSNYAEPENNQDKLVRIPDLDNELIDGDTKFTGSINAGVTKTFTINIGTIAKLGLANEGHSVVESTSNVPSGMAPVQLELASR